MNFPADSPGLFFTFVTNEAQDRHVLGTDRASVPQQAEGPAAQHHPAQLQPPLEHADEKGRFTDEGLQWKDEG